MPETTPHALILVGYDWTGYIEYVVRELEGDTTEDAVVRREKEMVEKIKEVIPCDVTKSDWLAKEYQSCQYDIVQTSKCLECVLDSREAYQQSIVKLATYLKPGGYIQIVTCLGCIRYTIPGFGHNLYVLKVEAEDVQRGCEMAGKVLQ